MPSPLKNENTITQLYDIMVAEGKLSFDEEQKKVALALTDFAALVSMPLSPKGWLNKIIPLKSSEIKKKQGIYIWGDVGRGKSLLMDMFFDNVPIKAKERIHFHSLMLGIHSSVHLLRKKKDKDPLITTAKELAARTTLLCLDEFQVTDVADAMILNRLFHELLKAGIYCVITSNRPPDELYMGGLQREKFLDFVALIEERMDILQLSSPSDYRLKQIRSLKSTYLTPVSNEHAHTLQHIFANLTNHAHLKVSYLEVQGRKLKIPESYYSVARFTFEQLCEKPLGSADYIAIAQHFDTVFIENIPLLTPEKRNEARRFVTLIDAFYEHKVKLICTAAAAPEKLYEQGDGSFEFHRTVSRLIEMQSEKYLTRS